MAKTNTRKAVNGPYLKSLMQERHLTPTQLAGAIGFRSDACVYNWINGKNITHTGLDRLAAYFQVDKALLTIPLPSGDLFCQEPPSNPAMQELETRMALVEHDRESLKLQLAALEGRLEKIMSIYKALAA